MRFKPFAYEMFQSFEKTVSYHIELLRIHQKLLEDLTEETIPSIIKRLTALEER